MNITALSSIVIAGAVAVIAALSGSSQYNKSGQPFTADKAEWQFENAMIYYCKETGKTREDLTQEDTDIIWERACNHMSMFLTWAIIRGHCGKVHLDEEPEAVQQLINREISGTDFFIKYCDCKLWREDFSEAILPFVDAYYESGYLNDYVSVTRKKLQKEPLTSSFSWDSYKVYEKMIDRAYKHWKFWEKPVIVVGKNR